MRRRYRIKTPDDACVICGSKEHLERNLLGSWTCAWCYAKEEERIEQSLKQRQQDNAVALNFWLRNPHMIPEMSPDERAWRIGRATDEHGMYMGDATLDLEERGKL